jgi:YVTN family beta-propeller protein
VIGPLRRALLGFALMATFPMTACGPGASGGTLSANAKALGLVAVIDVALPGSSSRLDYQSLDAQSHSLYIAHLDAIQVIVVDTMTQQVRAVISNVSKVHGVLAVPQLNRVYASATGTNQVAIIDAENGAILARTAGGTYPDGLAYDPDDGKVFVSDETGGTVTVVDTKTNQTVATIDAGGEVGNTQYDPVSRRVFSAVQSRNQLVAIDPESDRVIARYDLPDCKHPHGLAIDAPGRVAFIACDENAKLLTFDLQSLRVTGQQTVGDSPDVLALDEGLHRLYVAAESGVLAVFEEHGPSLTKVGQAQLAPNAHTVAVDQQSHRVYLPLENVRGKPVLRIMEPATMSGMVPARRRKSMKWVTRERPAVDRIACPWLIKRFVDPEAEFLYVPGERVIATAEQEGATPYDVPNAELGHHGDECSFDAVIKKYGLTDPALQRLALIVRGADTSANDLTPESRGLLAIAQGFRLSYQDDHQQLAAESPVYDALYAFCQSKEAEATSSAVARV